MFGALAFNDGQGIRDPSACVPTQVRRACPYFFGWHSCRVRFPLSEPVVQIWNIFGYTLEAQFCEYSLQTVCSLYPL